MNKFCRFELRTTDVAGARAFYENILGHDRSAIWPLHAQALARGARPHWLGTVGAEDPERVVRAFVEGGGTRLGPTPRTSDGEEGIVVRDPGGAVLALAPPSRADTPTTVAWHVLNSRDAVQATKNYVEQLGWQPTERLDLGTRGGVFQQFAWSPGGESVGAIGDIAGRPDVHPHWLFFFQVEAIDVSIAAVRAAGGSTIEATTLDGGQRVCVLHDPQGAEFALWERSAS